MNRLILRNAATTIRIPLPADVVYAGGTFAITSPAGAAVASGSLTMTSYAVTAPAAAGSRTLTFASTAGAKRGDTYLLAQGTGGPLESVTVVGVTPTTVILSRGLLYERTTATVARPQWATVPVAAITTLGRGYRATVTMIETGGVDAPTATRSVLLDVVAYVPSCGVTYGYLRSRYPSTFSALAGPLDEDESGFDLLIQTAWDLVLSDVAKKIKPDFIMSDEALSEPTVARILLLMAEDGRYQAADMDRRGVVDARKASYEYALSAALASMGWVDANQDGIVDEGETDRAVGVRVVLNPF